jgi:hypothetical protein
MANEAKSDEKGKVEIPKVDESNKQVIEDADKQVGEVTGDDKIFIMASSSRKQYEIRPCSLKAMPKLAGLLSKVENIMNEEVKAGKNEYQIIMNQDNGLLGTIAEIIQIGIRRAHPNKTLEEIQDEFSIADFPKAYERILSLNDFLAGMAKVQKIA